MARPSANANSKPGDLLVVVHDFKARSTDELSLAKGDRIELIEKDDEFGDGWYLGRHAGNSTTGLFPEVYTAPTPKGTFTNAVPQQVRRSDGAFSSAQNSYAAPTPSSPTKAAQSSTAVRPVSVGSIQQSSASPMAQTALRTSIPPTPRTEDLGPTSPVMTETLSVIDEHMSDMNTPPGSFTNATKRASLGASGDMFSGQRLGRMSYIAGHETDEEEHQTHTEEEVSAWTPDRVGEYLEDHGVEKSHCDIFKEQEISGEVLLAMEQSSLFLKEFELGSVGRRLKTWHKVRALQDEVRQNKKANAAQNVAEPSLTSEPDADVDPSRNRAATMGSVFPRALETRSSGSGPSRNGPLQPTSPTSPTSPTTRNSAVSPLQSMTSVSRAENTYRPSAQVIREMQHSRRRSSIDADSTHSIESSRQSHRKQPSLDQTWQPGQPQVNGGPSAHSHTLSAGSAFTSNDSTLVAPSSPRDVDRGYFSSNEADARSKSNKKFLSKRTSTGGVQARTVSAANRRSTTSGSRLSGSDFFRDSTNTSPSIGQGVFNTLHAVGHTFGSMRSSTSPTELRKPPSEDISSPVVTKLEYDNTGSSGAVTPNTETLASPSSKMPFFSASRSKMTGLRTISDAITRGEKSAATPPIKSGEVITPARTGSTTPSTESRSIELYKSDAQSRISAGSTSNLVPPAPAAQRRMRAKTKKYTSAYTRGLVKKTPAEAIADSDYSGWMKKKSGSLMTTWKTRLFVLKGRRLSYFYSNDDTEEKGLIDISFHRVLPAHNEMLTNVHAAVTGATATPTSPRDSIGATQTAAAQDLIRKPSVGESHDGMFIFKLVPPKSGLAKGVNFTKPTVHYFAVNSRQEGRFWMAALMKATIDRDEDGRVTTTYNQKTISLAKARARRERPPALKESDAEDNAAELDAEDGDSHRGLGIGGLSEKGEADVSGGAEKERDVDVESSRAPSTVATGAESFNEKEVVEPVAA